MGISDIFKPTIKEPWLLRYHDILISAQKRIDASHDQFEVSTRLVKPYYVGHNSPNGSITAGQEVEAKVLEQKTLAIKKETIEKLAKLVREDSK